MTAVERHTAKRLAAQRAMRKAQRAGYDAAGLCTRCGGPRDTDGKTCSACKAYAAAAARKTREKHRAAGLCYECGARPAEGPGLRCQLCREHDMTRQRCARTRRWPLLRRVRAKVRSLHLRLRKGRR